MGPFTEAPTVIALGAVPGELIEFSVGISSPFSPSLPAATTTVNPRRIAFSTASTFKSQATLFVRLQIVPRSSGPHTDALPEDSDAISIPSRNAASNAATITSSKVVSFTPGDP